MAWLEDWAKRREITIDGSKIDASLTNFPVLITLSSGTGITGVDTTDIFTELSTSGTGAIDANVFMDFEGDLSSYKHDIWFVNASLRQLNSENLPYFSSTNYTITDSLASFDFSTGDFTMECWFYYISTPSTASRLFTRGEPSSNNGDWTFGAGPTYLGVSVRSGGTIYSFGPNTITWSGSRWYHTVLQRESGVMKMFLDGAEIASQSMPYSMDASTRYLYIGSRITNTSEPFGPGYMKSIRISKGIARYSGNFTPSTTYTNDAYTSFLWYGTHDGEKASSFHQLTALGSSTSISSITPFNRGASLYADGGGLYSIWQLPHSSDMSLDSNNFTIEFWARYTSFNTYCDFFSKRATDSQRTWIAVGVTSSNYQLNYVISTNGSSWGFNVLGPVLTANVWFHSAIVREGDEIRLYHNGYLYYVGTLTGTIHDLGQPLTLCAAATDGSGEMKGYLYGFRLSKGIVRYTGVYDPPDTYPESNTNRRKIAVTDANNNQLYTEIEKWDHANKKAWLWTKVPTLSSGVSSKLYLYYDKTKSDNISYVDDTNAAASRNVWDSNHVAVYHFGKPPVGTTTAFWDSTANQNHGTPTNVNPTTMYSLTSMGYTYLFDGSDDYMNVPDHNTLDLTTNYSLEVMIFPTSSETVDGIINKCTNDITGYQFRGDTGIPNFMTGFTTPGDSVWTQNNWYYYTGTLSVSGTTALFYRNGVLVDTHTQAANSTPTNTNALFIGRRWDTYYFNGNMNEIRLSDTARPAEWIKATYYTLWNNLLYFGSTSTSEPPVYTCSGIVTVDNLPTDAIPVCLYRRSTGELAGRTTTVSGGHFTIGSMYNEDHYVVALNTTSGTNAKIYDWISP